MTDSLNPTAIALFLAFVALTLLLSYFAARRTHNSEAFYTGGGGITGLQNGAAIAGDYMSAASFLGVTGLLFVGGYDALIFGLGAIAGWPLMLILFSERVRNLGRYTFTDVVSERLDGNTTRIIAVFSTVTIVVMYLIAQMVGAGSLVTLLFGLPYNVALIVVSVLVIIYVAFGGMLATTWVQITKAVMLLIGVSAMALLMLASVDFDLDTLLQATVDRHPKGSAVLGPGAMISDPIQAITILVSMMFGCLGLPHVLMRLFTVPNMHEARRSVFYASGMISYFYMLVLIIGISSAGVLYAHPELLGANGQPKGGGNMVAVTLAGVVGGDLLLGFISAVAFATILAVVAGLTVAGAAAISHDLYSQVLCKGKPDPTRELWLTRITTIVIGLMAIGLGILFEGQNIAFIATMPMVVAASVNFPLLLLSLYWRRLSTRGALWGAVSGLLASVGLTVIGPKVWVDVLGFESALFGYDYPALFTMPLAFFVCWLVSVTDHSARAEIDRVNFDLIEERAEFGR